MRFCFALTILAAGFTTVAAATIDDCKKDSNDIALYVRVLDKSLKDLNNNLTLAQGITIHDNTVNLKRALTKASLDFKATPPFSAADSQDILKLVESYSPIFLHLLATIVEKKSVIISMPFPGIVSHVRDALAGLHRSNIAFEDAWISSSTIDVKYQARFIIVKTDVAFARADVAYAL